MITRRTVLKSIAAALMAPTIELRQSVPDERLLAAFCSSWEGYRYQLQKPFGVGSLTYACDNRAMIRCELASRVENGELRLPNVEPVWRQHWRSSAQWRPLTPDDLIATENVNGLCPHCGDRRVSFGEEYPESQEQTDSLPEYDIDDNTIRDVSCPECHGKEYTGPSCVRIDGVLHSSWNLRRILALPNPMVCRSQYQDLHDKGSNHASILFRADGFEGISMGTSPQ